MTSSTRPVRIIPCLDVNAGRVVKGINFTHLVDAGDPVEVAQRYSEQGADELTLLDITATTQGREHMVDVVRAVAKVIRIPLIVGGGIRSLSDISSLLKAGATKVSIASAALEQPQLIQEAAKQFGSEHIIVAIDAQRNINAQGTPRWEVVSHGGTKNTGLDAVEWAKTMANHGAGELLLTSMDRDGTKEGFDLALTKAVADAVTIPVIASGGVGSLQHLADGVLKGNASAVLAASLFHFGQASIQQAKDYLREQGIAVTGNSN